MLMAKSNAKVTTSVFIQVVHASVRESGHAFLEDKVFIQVFMQAAVHVLVLDARYGTHNRENMERRTPARRQSDGKERAVRL